MTDSLVSIFSDIAAEIGLSRPAGQCFAAIWRAASPPCADDLTTALGLSRSNVSTALKDLRGWGLIAVARSPGDRREYFTAPGDPWEVFRLILAARHRRTLASVIDRLSILKADKSDARAADLHDASARIGNWLSHLSQLDAAHLARYAGSVDAASDPTEKRKKKKRKT